MAKLRRTMKRLKFWWEEENGADYIHLFIYIVISSAVIFLNKLLLSSEQIKFPYPVGLSFLQMAFSSALCLITLKVMKARGIEHPGDRNFKETKQNRKFGLLLHCISGALALSLWLRNSAYLYTSVAFMQVLKITFHIAVAVLENVLENGATQYKMLLSTIILGVIVASYGEVSSSWRGVGYQMGSVICEALRLIVIQYLGVYGGVWLNSISAMFCINFFSSAFFPVPWMFWEKPMIDSSWPWGLSVPCILIILNCLLMFALNLYTCLVISHMSALRFARAKSFRDLVVVFLFPFLLGDTGLTLTSTIGYLIALVGLLVYYPLKEKALVEDERMLARSERRKVGSRVNLRERARVRLHALLGDIL